MIGWISADYATIVPPAKATVTTPATGTVLVKFNALRVRSEGSLSGKILTKVNKGQQFKLLETKKGWYKIELKSGVSGWVSATYASVK